MFLIQFDVFYIFSQNLEIIAERTNSLQCLTIDDIIIERHIDKETIFPLASDDRHGLYLGEVDAIEAHDGKHF